MMEIGIEMIDLNEVKQAFMEGYVRTLKSVAKDMHQCYHATIMKLEDEGMDWDEAKEFVDSELSEVGEKCNEEFQKVLELAESEGIPKIQAVKILIAREEKENSNGTTSTETEPGSSGPAETED
jgi:hypothetical protein